MPRRNHPKHRKHVTGQGTVRLNGKDYYTGKWGTPEAQAEYDRLISEYLAKRLAKPDDPFRPESATTVGELVLIYVRHAQTKYVRDGQPTKHVERVKRSLSHLARLYGPTPLKDFGPLALKAVRQSFVDAGWSRNHVNHCAGVIKTMFRWAVENELVGGSQYQAILAVPILPKGDQTVKPSKTVSPAVPGDVEKTLAETLAVVRDLATVQHLTAMRAGEVCQMRPCDIDRDGTDPAGVRHAGVWTYRPPTHKTEKHGHARCVFIGPKAQAVLAKYLDRPPDACLFSPREAVAAWLAAKGCRVRLRHKRAPGTQYATGALDKALKSAARRAGVPSWSTHQLRHLRATEVRAKYGPDHARIVLGHHLPGVTGVYAEDDWGKAALVMREIG